MIFGIIAIFITVGGVLNNMAIDSVNEILFLGATTLEDETVLRILPQSARELADIHLSLIVVGGICVWFLISYNIIQMTRRIRKDKYIQFKPEVRKILYQLILGNAILLTGAFFSIGELIFAEILVIIGYTIIYIRFLYSGIFILQSNSLQRLIVLNMDGTPLYSYNFLLKQQETITIRENKEEGQQEEEIASEDEDILFSGALQAVSMLLSQLMGTKQQLKEIVFEDVNLITYHLPKSQTSFILVSEQVTQFYREALENFAQKLPEKVDLNQKNMMFNDEQNKIADELVLQYFGV